MQKVKILRINASARSVNSYSRMLTDRLISKLKQLYTNAIVTEKELTNELPLLSEAMVEGMFISPSERTTQQAEALKVSDEITKELKETNILVIGVPVYNFGIPGGLKAYIDLVTRAGLTFQYDATGSRGLIENVKAYIVITSGGTALYSNQDFISGYLQQILGFIGIKEISFIDATQILLKGEQEVINSAMAVIEGIGSTPVITND